MGPGGVERETETVRDRETKTTRKKRTMERYDKKDRKRERKRKNKQRDCDRDRGMKSAKSPTLCPHLHASWVGIHSTTRQEVEEALDA